MRPPKLIEGLLTSLIVVILAAVVFPKLAGAGSPAFYRGTCLSHVKESTLALIMYDSDNDRLPFANKWMDGITEYTHSEVPFHCPFVPPDKNNDYGYAMQSKLGRVPLKSIKKPEEEPLIFDSNLLTRNAHSNVVLQTGFTRQPGQVVGYADGHAKAIKPAKSAP